jgi:putative transposase
MSEITVFRNHRHRLALTSDQEERLYRWAGVIRLTYNLALEQRRDFWRQYQRTQGNHISFVSQCAEIKDLRAAFDWIADVPADTQIAALKDLDASYRAFFARRASYPTPRKRGLNDSLRVRGKSVVVEPLNRKWAKIRFPKIGWIKVRLTRPIDGDLRNVTIRRSAGQWFVTFTCRQAVETAPASAEVGIDRGVARTITLSTGEHYNAPNQDPLNARRKRAQRRLAGMKRGSGRSGKQKARVAALSARAGRIRTDWCHRTSTDIANRFGLVAIEALNVKGMTASASGTVAQPGTGVAQKRGLNRSILEQCWGRFGGLLAYKLEARGGTLIAVPAAYTSQTCAECGVVDARSRKSQAIFECVACGHADNADVNAAREVLRRSTSKLGVEGQPTGPTKRQPQEPHASEAPKPALPGVLISPEPLNKRPAISTKPLLHKEARDVG